MRDVFLLTQVGIYGVAIVSVPNLPCELSATLSVAGVKTGPYTLHKLPVQQPAH